MRNTLLKLILAIISFNAYSYDIPLVKAPLSNDPKSFLLIGNSFMYYNNSVHKPLLGIHNSIKNNTLNIKARTFYINGSALSWHDVEPLSLTVKITLNPSKIAAMTLRSCKTAVNVLFILSSHQIFTNT